MNYGKSSSVLKLWLNRLLAFFLVLLLDYLLVEIHQLCRSRSWHSPPVRRVSSLFNRFSVSLLVHVFLMENSSVSVSPMDFFLRWVLFFLFVDRTHSVSPVDSVLFFSFGKTISFSGVISFDLFAGIEGELFDLFDFGFEFLVFVLKFVEFFWVVGWAMFLLFYFFLKFFELFFNVGLFLFEFLDFFFHTLLVDFELLLQLF